MGSLYLPEIVPSGTIGDVVAVSISKLGFPRVAWAEIDPGTGDFYVFYSFCIQSWEPPTLLAGPITAPILTESPVVNIAPLYDGTILVSWLDEGYAAPGLYGRLWTGSAWEPTERLFDQWGMRTVNDHFPEAMEIHLASNTIQPACPCNAVIYTSGTVGNWSATESIGSGHTGAAYEWPRELAIHVSEINVPHLMWRHESYDSELYPLDERLMYACKDDGWSFDDTIAANLNAHDPMISTTTANEPFVVWCDDSDGPGFDIYMAKQTPFVGVPDLDHPAPPANLTAVIAPNPIRRRAAIDVTAAVAGPLRVRVFDAQGRLVTMLGREMSAGSTQLVWDGLNNTGTEVANGVYYLRIEAAGEAVARRVVVLR